MFYVIDNNLHTFIDVYLLSLFDVYIWVCHVLSISVYLRLQL